MNIQLKVIIILAIVSILLLSAGCKERQNSGDDLVFREVTLDIDESSNNSMEENDSQLNSSKDTESAALSVDAKTVLVMAMNGDLVGSEVTGIQQAAENFFDRNLMNIDNGNVSLSLPIGYNVALMVYVYDQVYSINQVLTGSYLPAQFGHSDKFKIESDTTSLSVNTYLQDISYKPTILVTNPINGAAPPAVLIGASTTISVTFNKPMNTASITANTSNTNCTGTIMVRPNNDNFSGAGCLIIPSSPVPSLSDTTFSIGVTGLSGVTWYYVRITTAAEDTDGNTMESVYNFNFQTSAF